jgi:hypothetical protein
MCSNVGNSEYLPTLFMKSDRIVGAASPIEERILNLAKSQSTIRTRDAIAGGIHPEDLRRLVNLGILLETIQSVKKRLNPNLKILGVLPTMAEKNTVMTQDIITALTNDLEDIWLFGLSSVELAI